VRSSALTLAIAIASGPLSEPARGRAAECTRGPCVVPPRVACRRWRHLEGPSSSPHPPSPLSYSAASHTLHVTSVQQRHAKRACQAAAERLPVPKLTSPRPASCSAPLLVWRCVPASSCALRRAATPPSLLLPQLLPPLPLRPPLAPLPCRTTPAPTSRRSRPTVCCRSRRRRRRPFWRNTQSTMDATCALRFWTRA
jgi:hypothetical protein